MAKLVIGLSGVLACATAAAAALPTVQVEFQIADPTFQREVGARRAAAEAAFRPILVEELAKRIGFLQFSAGPAPAAPQPLGQPPAQPGYRLLINLGDSTAGPLRDVRFNLTLIPPAGVGQPGQPPVSWLFRSSQDSLRPLSRKQDVDEKIRDVDLVGGSGQPGELRRQFALGDFKRLVTDLLSRIPIAADASMQAGLDPKWLLPLRRGEVCMDLHSRFRIAHLLRENGSEEELPLEVEATGPPDSATDALLGPIVARVPDAPDQRRSLGRLAASPAPLVRITGIFVTEYLRRAVCSDAPAPLEAGLGQGGSQ